MKIEEIQFLFDYTYWARDRILVHAAKLSPDQILEPKSYPHGSIRNNLVHILGAEWIWRIRCQEHLSPTQLLPFGDYPTLESIFQAWQREEKAMRGYLNQLTFKDLDGIIQYKRINGEPQEAILWQVLIHVVNHGTEHRSIIAADLTGYGCSPGDLDIRQYLITTSQ